MREAENTFIEKIKSYLKRYDDPNMEKAESLNYSSQQRLGDIIFDAISLMKVSIAVDFTSLTIALANVLLRYHNNELDKSVKVKDQLKQALENHNEDGSRKSTKQEKEESYFTPKEEGDFLKSVCGVLKRYKGSLSKVEMEHMVKVGLIERNRHILDRYNTFKMRTNLATELLKKLAFGKMQSHDSSFIFSDLEEIYTLGRNEHAIEAIEKFRGDEELHEYILYGYDAIHAEAELLLALSYIIHRVEKEWSNDAQSDILIAFRRKNILVKKLNEREMVNGLTVKCIEILNSFNDIDYSKAQSEEMKVRSLDLVMKLSDCFIEHLYSDIMPLLVMARDADSIYYYLANEKRSRDIALDYSTEEVSVVESSPVEALKEFSKVTTTFNRKPYNYTVHEETIMEKFDIKEHIKTSIADRGSSLKSVSITGTSSHEVKSSEEPERKMVLDLSLLSTLKDVYEPITMTQSVKKDFEERLASISIKTEHGWPTTMTMHPEGHWDKEKYLQNKVTELNLLLVKKLVESGIEHGAYLEEATKLTDFGNNFITMYSYAIGLDQEWFVTDVVDRAWIAYCETHM